MYAGCSGYARRDFALKGYVWNNIKPGITRALQRYATGGGAEVRESAADRCDGSQNVLEPHANLLHSKEQRELRYERGAL
ncbi:hypothetical protein NDU88_002749 [Pleurodeles waltl]|uniref:Uncharacterized protein n=1 Tax=Pleurodeles waltl TaxID=8319 RepID=A0AAV7NJH7_PLEWA|nr:hypothetical protein NDU88_002749 [Pleurodeles waltl]